MHDCRDKSGCNHLCCKKGLKQFAGLFIPPTTVPSGKNGIADETKILEDLTPAQSKPASTMKARRDTSDIGRKEKMVLSPTDDTDPYDTDDELINVSRRSKKKRGNDSRNDKDSAVQKKKRLAQGINGSAQMISQASPRTPRNPLDSFAPLTLVASARSPTKTLSRDGEIVQRAPYTIQPDLLHDQAIEQSKSAPKSTSVSTKWDDDPMRVDDGIKPPMASPAVFVNQRSTISARGEGRTKGVPPPVKPRKFVDDEAEEDDEDRLSGSLDESDSNNHAAFKTARSQDKHSLVNLKNANAKPSNHCGLLPQAYNHHQDTPQRYHDSTQMQQTDQRPYLEETTYSMQHGYPTPLSKRTNQAGPSSNPSPPYRPYKNVAKSERHSGERWH